jgi:TolB-like protein/Tfp pilus assembly protein PilF
MSLSPGTRLGPYEILAPLGAGGMGEVYRARDERLGRQVALKVLPESVASDPARLARFEQEARSASALNHPNIVTIYDVGREGSVSYIAMELVDGASLRQRLAGGPLPLRFVLDVGAQIASGLAKAHAASLVHRDLKPENVMVTADGLVKILDFGLAKLAPAVSAAELASRALTQEQSTEPGVILGTVGYMSPEQATGGPLDFRSDQFSLGVMLYEMTAGLRPFQGKSALETLSAILRTDPPPLAAFHPDAPEALSTIVVRCLAKQPEGRYASTRDLARDLAELRDGAVSAGVPVAAPARRARVSAWTAAAFLLVLAAAGVWIARRSSGKAAISAGGEKSIAILPFQNFGGRSEDEYFSDGMTESLITDLAKAKGLLVIARNSVFAYKNKNVDVRKVGEDLHVRYVLEGSVQRAGDSVRVNAQLIDAASGYHVWAEKYDRPMKDLFAVQDDLSARIVGSLQAAIGGSHTAVSQTPTSNLEAYDLFLRGRYFMNQFDWARKDDSMPLLEKAIALDPGFAQAHAALAAAYAKKAFEGDPDGSWRSKASAEIEKALALDPNLPQAYLARGNLAWTRDNGFPHEQAAADFHKAIELGSDAAHAGLANVYYHVGLLDKALAQYALALRTDPHDLDSLYRIPRIHLYQGKYAEALAEFDASPQFRGDFYVPIVLAHLGRWEEALRRAPAPARHPTHPTDVDLSDQASTMAVLAAHAGDAAAAESEVAIALKKQGRSHFHHASYNLATAFALLKRNKEAIAWLVETAESGMPCYPLFEKDPFLDSLRDDPEFQAFLARQRAQFERFQKTL